MSETMSKFDLDRHRHNIEEYDKKIVGLEAELARLHEARREYINRYNLNKLMNKTYPV